MGETAPKYATAAECSACQKAARDGHLNICVLHCKHCKEDKRVYGCSYIFGSQFSISPVIGGWAPLLEEALWTCRKSQNLQDTVREQQARMHSPSVDHTVVVMLAVIFLIILDFLMGGLLIQQNLSAIWSFVFGW